MTEKWLWSVEFQCYYRDYRSGTLAKLIKMLETHE